MKIVIATDGSEDSRLAEKFAVQVVDAAKCETELISAVPTQATMPYDFQSVDLAEQVMESAMKVCEDDLASDKEYLESAGWRVETVQRRGSVVHEITAHAEESNADLIWMGARGLSGVKRFFLGSVSSGVVRHAKCPVLIHRGETVDVSEEEPIRILFSHDGSENSDRALEYLRTFPWKRPVKLKIIRIIELVEAFNIDAIQHSSNAWKREVKAFEDSLESCREELEKTFADVASELHQSGDVAEEILQSAEAWNAELVVVGHKGRNPVTQFLLGSVAYRVAEHAPCSVLVVR